MDRGIAAVRARPRVDAYSPRGSPHAGPRAVCVRVYWFNPLVWYAAAALARERERACDDEVLRLGATPSAYASLLLDLARSQIHMDTGHRAEHGAAVGHRGPLVGHSCRVGPDTSRIHALDRHGRVGCCDHGDSRRQTSGAATADRSEAESTRAHGCGPEPTPTTVTGALIEALSDASGQVREQAAIGLALTPGGDVIDPLLKALKDADPQVREKAAIGLSFRRDARIVQPLLGAIEDDDPQVREKAAIALGASGDDRAIGALQKAMRDPDPQVREKAVAGLVLLGLRK